MKTLKISEQKARDLYKAGSEELKTILEESFGKEFFSQKITDRIKTYEDACEEIGIDPICEKKWIEIGLSKDDIVYQKLKTIAKALNEGWSPNVCDSSVRRWYPWFIPNSSPSSFAFNDSFCDPSYASAGSGSRLKFKTSELAKYAGKQFVDIWKDIQIG